MYQGALKLTMCNAKTGAKLAKAKVGMSQCLRQGA